MDSAAVLAGRLLYLFSEHRIAELAVSMSPLLRPAQVSEGPAYSAVVRWLLTSVTTVVGDRYDRVPAGAPEMLEFRGTDGSVLRAQDLPESVSVIVSSVQALLDGERDRWESHWEALEDDENALRRIEILLDSLDLLDAVLETTIPK